MNDEQVGDLDTIQDSKVVAPPLKELSLDGVEVDGKPIPHYESGVEKENKKVRKKGNRLKKRRKASDPLVKDVAELLSNGLRIISPDKPYKGQNTQGNITDFLCNKITVDDGNNKSNKIQSCVNDSVNTSINNCKHEENCDNNSTLIKDDNNINESVCDENEINDKQNIILSEDSQDFQEQVKSKKVSKPIICTDSEDSQEVIIKNADDNLINGDSECSQDVVEIKMLSPKDNEKKSKKQKPVIVFTDSEDSQDAFEKKEFKKKKQSRLSQKSPKGKKFKDCSQQSKLNAFIQIKTPPDHSLKRKEQPKDACNKLKLSSNLFMSPKSSKKSKAAVDNKKTEDISCEEAEEIVTISVPEDSTGKEISVGIKGTISQQDTGDTLISSTNTPKKKKAKGNVNKTPKIKEKSSVISISEEKEANVVTKEQKTTDTITSSSNTQQQTATDSLTSPSNTPKKMRSKVDVNTSKTKEKPSEDLSSNTPKKKKSVSDDYTENKTSVATTEELHTLSSNTPKKIKSKTTLKLKQPNEKSLPPVASNSPNEKSAEIPTTPQRNAFQFMMNQRNKVIGSNSPGKVPTESPEEENLDSKDMEKKEKLSKRKKQFSEWNNSKGTKRKLEEEDREAYTEKVLESRAKLMKEMLTGIADDVDENQSKKKKPGRKRKRVVYLETTSESSNDSLVNNQEDSNPNKRSKLDAQESGKVQKGLHNFFGVKQKDTSNEVIQVFENEEEDKPTPLKVKFIKSRGRKKKSLSLKKESSNDDFTDDENIGVKKINITDDEASRSSNFSDVSESTNSSADVKISKRSRGRPKKTVNLNISFASIKGKLLSKLNNPVDNSGNKTVKDDEVVVVDDNVDRKSARKKTVVNYVEDDLESSNQTKSGRCKDDKEKKVAPVFLKSAPKPKEDPAVVQARLDFLRSGVPNALKKIAEKQQSFEDIDFDVFPLISHIQQKDSNPSPLWNLPPVELNFIQTEKIDLQHGLLSLGNVTTANTENSLELNLRPVTKNLKYKTILEEIKMENPKYPVYKTFRLLSEKAGRCFDKPNPVSPAKTPTPVKRKRGRPRKKTVIDDDVVIVEETPSLDVNPADYAMWTEKYKPKSSQDIIGNYKSVSELRDWLNGWIEFSKEVRVSKKKQRSSDSSDFESTDGESRDSVRLPCNTMVLQGPVGSGKSVAVYAVCQELGVNVLEINASSKRTGKKLLQDMQEATQSHQVSKKETNSLAAFLHKEKIPQELQEAKSKAQNKMCILLIEDADIVFDQDEGFISALNQLILTSKRPVVLLTSNVDCNYMQKFTSTYPVLNFTTLSAKALATWLQIVCLLEGVHVDKSTIGELLEWNKGDVRRTLLQLQFWVHTGGNPEDQTSEMSETSLYKKYCDVNTLDDFIYEDDTVSSLSNFEELESLEKFPVQNNCIKSFIICNPCKWSIPFPLNSGVIWWNLPDILVKPKTEKQLNKKEEFVELQRACDVLDVLSFNDVLNRSEGIDGELEPTPRRWDGGVKEGLSLKEDGVDYKTDRSLTQEISHDLVEGYCRLHNPDFCSGLNMAVPVASEIRWRTKQQECEDEYLNVIPSSYSVHRSTFAVDYFPALRTITRTESERAHNNRKRGNRFYNYLRTLNIHPSSSTIKTACNMMTSKRS